VSAWGLGLLQDAAAPDHVPALLATLVAIFVVTRLLGELAQRLGQPAVLGELVAGILLGGSVLGVIDPSDPVIHAMAEIGVIVLLFETGLHTELRSLLGVGSSAAAVGLAGVVIPSVLGYLLARTLGVGVVPSVVCATALCATSVGISARVLSDLGCLDSPEGRVVLGAAVLDDIVGLVILSVVASLVGGQPVSGVGVARTATIATLFVVLAIVVGSRVAPVTFRAAERRLQADGTLGVLGLAFAFTLAWLASAVGSATIIGAFAAGVVLYALPQRQAIERSTTVLGHFFVPVFFASVGAAVDLRALANVPSMYLGAVLIGCGILGKVAAGFTPIWFGGRKLLVGVAMIPRGEVGLIFAQLGLTSGAIDKAEFGAVMAMVLATTLVTPPLLGAVARRSPLARSKHLVEEPGDGGIDDLVAGTATLPAGQRRTTPRGTSGFRSDEPR
jgi:Kef-type K+ transport system membrane component KefB